MNAGRELNNLIAEKIFGHKVVHKTWNKGLCHSYTIGEPDYYDSAGEMILHNPVPQYSEDMNEAWEVVKHIGQWKFSLTWEWDIHKMVPYATAIFDPVWIHRREKLFVKADTAPLAICLAALKTKEEE